MAATYTAEVLGSRSERRLVEFDPDSGSATDVTLNPEDSEKYLTIDQFRRFIAGVMVTVGTGGITTVKLVAATAADGTGGVDIVSKTATTADAVGDYVWVECDVEQVREVLSTATHIGVEIDLVTSTDECAVFFERAEPMFPRTGLTADYIS